MLELPEIVVLGGGIHAKLRSFRWRVIVKIQPGVQWNAILDLQIQGTCPRLRTRGDFGIDLPIPIGIGPIKIALEDQAVQQNVSLKIGQGSDDVVRAEMAII